MRLSYRPDIDGLRAIAVAIVVAFHAGVPGFGGGFVGVDVFFVISGFLITGLLVEELRETGSISLSRFYARRARRLLPALALVLVATILLGSVLLLGVAGEQQDLAKSALAATLSVSNIWFWSVSNYFSVQADLVPLLHTWSLSVEEQYYLVWPTMLIALMLVARKSGKSSRVCSWRCCCWWQSPPSRGACARRRAIRPGSPGICAGCFTTSPRATTSRAARVPSRTSDGRHC